MALECQKPIFSLPHDIHYLNNATLGPMNKHAEQAGMEAMLLGRNPLLRSRHMFFEPVQLSKTLFAQLINAPTDHVAIISSASYGLATAANNIDLKEGDEIVILEDQFPSNYYIWKHKCDAVGAHLKIISSPDSSDRSADWTADIIAAITSKTKVVTLAHVHWMDGTYFDLEAIGKQCRAHGSYLIIDGTQSIGALPFDVEKIKPDALIVASYKWMLGNYGLGYAYYSDRLLGGQPLEMNWINMEQSHDFENLTDYNPNYRPGAARYNMGEQSSFISIAMTNQSLKLLNQWQPSNLQAYVKSLTEDAWQILQSEGISIDTAKPSYHLTGLRFNDQWDMDHLQKALLENNIVISRRGTALRISVSVYNDESDITALVDTILSNRK